MCQGYTVCPLAKVPIFLNFGTSEVERQGNEYNRLMILALSITQGIEGHQVGTQRSLGELEDSFKRTWVGSAEKLRNLLEITQLGRRKAGT